MSPDAVALVKEFEGFHRVVVRRPVVLAAPYLCPAGYWTIGYGTLCAQDHQAITIAEGETMMKRDLERFEREVYRLCPVLYAEHENRAGALISFAYNLGSTRLASSTLRRRVNARDWRGAANEFGKWVWGGGQRLPGLVRRRAAEAQLLLRVNDSSLPDKAEAGSMS